MKGSIVPNTPILNHRLKKRRGVVIVFVAIILLALILLVGLALDTAQVVLVGIQLQNTADAAALAGARLVRDDQDATRQFTYDYALLNFAFHDPVILEFDSVSNTGDVVLGSFDMPTNTFTPMIPGPDAVLPNSVKAVTRKTSDSPNGSLPLLFGPIADVFESNLTRDAIAMPVGGFGPGIIALAEEGVGVHFQGSLEVEIEPDGVIYTGAAGIQINSNDPDEALKITGNIGDVDIDEVNFDVGGGADDKHGDLEEVAQTDTGDVPDPLKWLQNYKPNPADYPDWSPADGNAIHISDGIHEFSPGYYSGGFSISGGDVTLKPGVYILGGGTDGKGGLDIRGNTNFYAKGVMFYITDNANVEINGTGMIQVHAMDYWDPLSTVFADPPPGFPQDPYEYPTQFDTEHYKGILFFQDNLDHERAKINGTALLDMKGSLYFPENTVYMSGTSDNFGTQFIAHRFELEGSGHLGIAYDGRFREAAWRSFLVE
ncbi:MAG: pilus assembly protein TadG-related protein [Planctomycetota bacterium]